MRDESTAGVAEWRRALAVGLVGGALIGVREALVTLQANAFVQPDHYFFGYLAVPILAWGALGMMLLLPVTLLLGALRRPSPGGAIPLYVAMLGAAAAVSIAAPYAAEVVRRMRAVGAEPTLAATATLWALGATFVLTVAAVGWAAADRMASQIERGLRAATISTLLVGVALLWPMVRFLATDWKWNALRASATAPAPLGAPNVLLISIDTLRADHVGAYGGAHGLTPHLDRLAASGIVFQRAITSSPWTLPAMASILTGLNPRHHGAGRIANNRDPLGRSPLPQGTWTVSAALQDHGYRTHAIVTNPYLSLHYGMGEGFETYENVTIESELFIGSQDTTAMKLATWLYPGLVVGDRGRTVSERARRWLFAYDEPQPFFLWLHYIDPHPPYSRADASPHKSFRGDLLLADGTGRAPLTLMSPDVARLRSGEIRLNDSEKEQVRALYRAEVASVDAAVGTVLDSLDNARLRERTVVVVVADHGEEFWDHGGVEHGHTVYEELVRVPLLIRWPARVAAPMQVDEVVRVTDIAPTILDFVGIDVPPGLDGTSLAPVLRGEVTSPREALIENMLFADERIGIRTGDRKFVRWAYGKEEVYDLAADAREVVDLGGLPAMREELRTAFDAAEAAPRRAGDAVAPVVAPQTREALRGLGYLD